MSAAAHSVTGGVHAWRELALLVRWCSECGAVQIRVGRKREIRVPMWAIIGKREVKPCR